MGGSGRGRGRAQSETVGVVLLVAIAVVGGGAVLALGGVALDATQSAATTGSTEHAMTQLDSKASLVAHGDTTSQRVRIGRPRDATVRVRPDAGWMNVTVRNRTDGTVETVVLNESLGAVVYEDGDSTIAYQGGGVWKRGDAGSSMLSSPEFHYRGTTLTLPLVLVRGDGTLGKRFRVTHGGGPTARYPNATAGRQNPLEDGEVNVTVRSRYYEAWGRFFEERTGGAVSYDHGAETVTITLVTPSNRRSVTRAVSASSTGDEFAIQGNGANPSFVDSYNSTAGNYTATKTGNGTIEVGGDVDMSGNARVEGDLRSGGTVSMSGGAEVTKTVYWTSGFNPTGASSYGGDEQISGVEASDSVDSLVRNEVDNLASDNDNGNSAAVDGDRLNFTAGTATLSASDGTEYYLDKVDTGKELVVETNGNAVSIGVENGFKLQQGGNVTVKGSGTVRFYVEDDVTFEKGSSLYVPGDVSQRAWIYGTSNTDYDLQGSGGDPVRVVGVLYAPDPQATATIGKADVFGGVATGKVTLDNGGAVHYDQNLGTVDPLPAGKSVPRVTYLHVSTTRVDVAP